MTAPARHSMGNYSAYGAYADEQPVDWELVPGERIGPSRRRNRGKILFLMTLILSGGAAGWKMSDGQVSLPSWAEIAALLPSTSQQLPKLAEPLPPASPPPIAELPPPRPVAADPSSMKLQPPVKGDVAAVPAGAPKSVPLTTAALPSAATDTDDAPPGPLPPVTADPSDPYQVRAVAVGLHPGLSRVLLSRLTPTDYRNAGIAIQTAVAETPDNGVYIWPRQRKPELALFKVHFVPGAVSDCRRYVVTVAKDGWVTTALPMERCGPKPGRGPEAKKAATDKSR